MEPYHRCSRRPQAARLQQQTGIASERRSRCCTYNPLLGAKMRDHGTGSRSALILVLGSRHLRSVGRNPC